MSSEIKPAICHLKEKIIIDQALAKKGMPVLLSDFVVDLVQSLEQIGCRLIGHIKGILDLGNNNILFFNTTSFTEKPLIKGDAELNAGEAELTLVVIVYGIKESDVEALVVNKFNDYFRNTAWLDS